MPTKFLFFGRGFGFSPLRARGTNCKNTNYLPGIMNRTQSNCISIELNRTKSNLIHGLSLIEFGNRTKSNSHKNNWTIELNRTLISELFISPSFIETYTSVDNHIIPHKTGDPASSDDLFRRSPQYYNTIFSFIKYWP